MTDWQLALVGGLLVAIVSLLLAISKQLDRLIQLAVQRQRSGHPDDENLRFQLGVFLEEANKPVHAATREKVDAFLSRSPDADA